MPDFSNEEMDALDASQAAWEAQCAAEDAAKKKRRKPR